MSRGKARRGEKHARINWHEWEIPAYQSLSCEARSLLIEFRMLYNGPKSKNRVHMSAREAQRRLGVGQHKAQKAIRQLVDRGWVRVIEPGGFQRKSPHATVYALTNEPLGDRDGATAPKDFLRWSQKSTVSMINTDGIGEQYRDHETRPEKPSDGIDHQYREPGFAPPTVSTIDTQLVYQGGLLRWLLMCRRETQAKVIWALLAAASPESLAA